MIEQENLHLIRKDMNELKGKITKYKAIAELCRKKSLEQSTNYLGKQADRLDVIVEGFVALLVQYEELLAEMMGVDEQP